MEKRPRQLEKINNNRHQTIWNKTSTGIRPSGTNIHRHQTNWNKTSTVISVVAGLVPATSRTDTPTHKYINNNKLSVVNTI